MKIPFDKKTGDLIHYPDLFNPPDWVENYEFEGCLMVEHTSRGRSSVLFLLTDSQGRRLSMFVKDMFDIIKESKINKGKIKGRFTFQKRGQNYGVRMVFDEKDKVKH